MSFNLNIKESLKTAKGKMEFNRVHFDISAPKYDVATRGLSLCRDQSWKRTLIELLPNVNTSPNCLDIACGTGDVCELLMNKFPQGRVTGVDLSEEMLKIANKRLPSAKFNCADMCNMPYEDGQFDIVTGSYAIRNAPKLQKCMKEVNRILTHGGVAYFLDFSKSANSNLAYLQYLMLKIWGSFWGLALHANPRIHGYICESFKNYPHQNNLPELFKESGFEIVLNRKLFGGIISLIGVKKLS